MLVNTEVMTRKQEDSALEELLKPEVKTVAWFNEKGSFDSVLRIKYRYEAITHKKLKINHDFNEITKVDWVQPKYELETIVNQDFHD
jgi:hypothetical protein